MQKSGDKLLLQIIVKTRSENLKMNLRKFIKKNWGDEEIIRTNKIYWRKKITNEFLQI